MASAETRTRKTADHRSGERGASLEDTHNPVPSIGSTGSLPSRSTVPEEESPGANDRKNGPPTSRLVQWIPVQLEGYNRGMEVK